MTNHTEERIGYVMRAGSLLSSALLALGLVALLVGEGRRPGLVLVHGGLVIVFATPILRVVVALVGFVQQREWRFVLMTLAVLSVLGASVVAAFSR